MSIVRKLGIWMDYFTAHLIEFSMDSKESRTLSSKFTHQQKGHSLGKSEKIMHNKEQHEQKEYFKSLSEAIKGYDEVVLFGPTDAKSEFFNILKNDHQFEKTIIEVQQAGKLTANQQQAFVRDYFSKKIIRI